MSIFFLIQINISKAEAANESKITFNLWSDGYVNQGAFVLNVPNLLGDTIYLSYSGKPGVVFHNSYPNTKYLEVTILRNGKSIFSASANGGTQQDVFINNIKNISLLKGDIIHFYLLEPEKQRLENLSFGQASLGEYVAPYFKKDMYYMITQDGFVPVNIALSVQTFSPEGLQKYISSFLYKNIVGYSEATEPGRRQFNPLARFQTYLPEDERFILSQYEIGIDHTLTVPKKKIVAYGKTTYGEMNELVKGMQVKIGNIYQTHYNDTEKVGIWNNGVLYPLKDLTQKTNYFEVTENSGLVELDFYKVKPKDLTLELGSDSTTIKVNDVTNLSNYPSLNASFKTDIKTDKLGSYDQSVVIKQNLITNNNYLQSEVTSKITIVDTTKPSATGKVGVKIPIYASLPINPADLLENIQDNSDITTLKINYIDENGDTSIPGIKVVKIRLTDVSGNFSDISVPITIEQGVLTISSVPNFDFDLIKLGNSVKNLNQAISEIEINDFRGTKEGWTLQVSMSKFSTSEGRKLNSDIVLMNGVVSSPDQTVVDGVSMYNVTLNESLQTIMQAKKNKGIKKWIGKFEKEHVFLENLSPDARIGLYESTLNWTLLNAP